MCDEGAKRANSQCLSLYMVFNSISLFIFIFHAMCNVLRCGIRHIHLYSFDVLLR